MCIYQTDKLQKRKMQALNHYTLQPSYSVSISSLTKLEYFLYQCASNAFFPL